MNGVVEGGWNFVWAAYGLTALILASYVIATINRYRIERDRAARESGREG
jgi:heme exporter protein CcmD